MSAAPLPTGFSITFDGTAREVRRGVWFGGQPARVLKLSAAGTDALDRLGSHPVTTRTEGLVARRLIDVGLAHSVPPPLDGPVDVTVIVPVHDRPEALARCLESLGPTYPVVVVDDASRDEIGVRVVAAEHGASIVRHATNRGPGAARNTGLERVHTELVAFVDSDTEPGSAWIAELGAHLADPALAAAAPRIVPRAGDTWAGRYTRARGTLDLGAEPARVQPYTRVSYVPTAALIARRSALTDVARGAAVFDPRLRVGEDVDLVWRLVAAGHRIRFVPGSTVPHDEPRTWRGLLHRRFRYGTSAAQLAARHPANVAPLVVYPWFTATVAALLARRPVLAGMCAAAAAARTRTVLRRADVPTHGLARSTAGGVGQTFVGVGRYATQFGGPLLAAALARGPSGRRLAAAALLLVPIGDGWRHRRAPLDPFRFAVGALADDTAYGAGVIAGCVRNRTSTPLRPVAGHLAPHR